VKEFLYSIGMAIDPRRWPSRKHIVEPSIFWSLSAKNDTVKKTRSKGFCSKNERDRDGGADSFACPPNKSQTLCGCISDLVHQSNIYI